MGRRVSVALPVVMLADVVALVTLRHCPAEAWRRGTQLRAWSASVGPDAAAGTLAGAAIWIIAAWLALALIAVWAARVPGLVGVLAGRASRLMVPGAVRMLLTGGAGLGVLITSTAAGAAPTPVGSLPAPRWPVSTSASTPAPTPTSPLAPAPTSTPVRPSSELPAPIWPSAGPPGSTPHRTAVSAVAGTPVTTPTQRPGPDASRPTSTPRPTSASRPTSTRRPPSTHRPDTPGSAIPTPPRSGSPSAPSPAASKRTDALTVRAGDSLWMLAAQRLTTAHHGDHVSAAGIAAEWPRWYEDNRAVVGSDPDLLVPGQVLHVPSAARTVQPGPPVADP